VQGDCITLPLGLPQVRVLSQEELPGGGIAVLVVLRAEARSCPECARLTAKVHDRRDQAKADASLGGRRVVLVLVRRRFRCPFCKKVFTEPDEVCGWRRRLTKRLRQELQQEAIRSTVKHVAEAKGVSQDTVRRALAEGARGEEENKEPVRYMGMDEFSVRKGQRYQTGFYDLTGKRVLGVIEGRRREGVMRFLAGLEHPELVEAVTMDMSSVYRSAVSESLPGVEIVADKFHVIRRVIEQLNRLRIRLQAEQTAKEELARTRYLLLKNREDLNAEQRTRLSAVLRSHPDLRRAYLLKEDFRRWYRPGTKSHKRLELTAWMRDVEESGPAEFRELLPMLTNWREEILNYFEFGLTNAFAEGKNTRTKLIQRQAYGYRNTDNLNLRILLPCT
jgi:transposase